MALSRERIKLLDRLKNKKTRSREGQFLVEGVRSAGEFLSGRVHGGVRFALVSPRLEASEGGQGLRPHLEEFGIPVEEISDKELEAVSDTEHPQGVVLVVREEERALPPAGESGSERVLILDGIQDPGNAGTLIRAARAFGLTRAVALEGTVDLFNPKVIRASAGALAHLPVHHLSWYETADWLHESGIPLLVGASGGNDVRSVPVPPEWAVAIGNEGAGVRSELQEVAEQVVGIPMDSETDSLNAGVAGAILMFGLNPPSV
jgi:TrmH family RNA methyltransferase